MTVSELIEELRKLPSDKEVSVAVDCEFAGMPCWDCRGIMEVDNSYKNTVIIKGEFKKCDII